MENYTAAANSRCFDFFDSGLYSAWDIIENTPEDTPPEVWKKD